MRARAPSTQPSKREYIRYGPRRSVGWSYDGSFIICLFIELDSKRKFHSKHDVINFTIRTKSPFIRCTGILEYRPLCKYNIAMAIQGTLHGHSIIFDLEL